MEKFKPKGGLKNSGGCDKKQLEGVYVLDYRPDSLQEKTEE